MLLLYVHLLSFHINAMIKTKRTRNNLGTNWNVKAICVVRVFNKASNKTTSFQKTVKHFICHYPALWEGYNRFLKTCGFIRGFVEDNANRKLASHSSLFRDFFLSALF